jgi:hypothetical protein
MTRYAASISIDLPVEAVYDYVSDIARHGEWAQHRLEIAPVEGSEGAGATYRSTAHQLGQQTYNEVEVVEASRPRRFAFEARGREGHFRHTFDLDEVGGSTRLGKTFEVLEVPWFTRLALPVFALIGPRNMRKDLARIKARLER